MSEWSKHRMNKQQRHEYVLRRARELATSGDHADWLMIETALVVDEEFPEARHWLDSRRLRDALDRMCEQAQKAKGK